MAINPGAVGAMSEPELAGRPIAIWRRKQGRAVNRTETSSAKAFGHEQYWSTVSSSSQADSRCKSVENGGALASATPGRHAELIAIGLSAASALIYGVLIAPAAHAEVGTAFTTPSGDIACTLTVQSDGKGSAVCEVVANMAGPAIDCPWRQSGMDRNHYTLDQGKAPQIDCGSTLFAPGLPTLEFGHSRTAGAITCYSRSQELTCTDDSGARHFFTVSTYIYRMA